jgi:HAE1 family hydrophobic/amphiphilic exporter-1
MWFTRVSIGNPVMAVMVMLALVVLGLFAVQRLKVDQFPNIEFPFVVVTTEYPGASPEVVELELTRKVEEAANTVAGINQIFSRSYEGASVVIVQFNLEMDGRRAAEDVREKLALVRPLLRAEIKEPRVQRFDPSSRPIWTVALTATDGTRTPVELSSFADQVIKRRLENVRGVGSVTLVGARKREINVYLKPAAMDAYGVAVDQVLQALRTENRDLPAGALRSRDAERVVQIDGAVQRPEQLRQIVVARRGATLQPVRLGQVADVVDGPEEPETLALYNGQRTLALDVQKSQGDNTIDVVDGLNRAVADLQPLLPAGMALDVVRDGSRPIRVAVANVQRTLVEGALLTVAIVFLFLNSWRSTVITGLTLPISLIGTFLFMHAFGFTINMITLMALSLCVGLLIDDAIVVRENIVRHVQMGRSARDASLLGTQEIGLAVLATTLSIVAVFAPIGFMGGIIGRFFHEFGITIVAAVLISMFVSFTLDPMLSAVWHDPAIDREGKPFEPKNLYDHTLGRLTHAMDRFQHTLANRYVALLGWSIRHRALTLLVALATMVASLGMIRWVGTEFVPKADFSETSVSFYTPVGSSLETTEARARQVDSILRELPEVRYTLSTINTGNAQGRNQASVYVRLVDRKDRSRSVDQLSGPLRERLAAVPGITVTHVGLLDAVAANKPLSLSVQGADLAELERITRALEPQLKAIPGLTDLDSSLKPNKPVLRVEVKREAAADQGFSVGSLTAALRVLLAGETVGQWRSSSEETHDIKLRLAPEFRDSVQDLQGLGLVSGTQADGSTRVTRLTQLVELRPGLGPNQINRRDLNREVEFSANTAGRSLGEVSADINRILAQTALPPGYSVRFGGATKDMQESFVYAIQALAMAIIFIYMILASQFRSFLQPVALMSSLPLTLIGVVLALLLWRSTLNMFSIIGVIMLMGLVTKNAILLVDFANRARDDGMSLDQALLEAARVRLRPILMTTLAMVFGMVPLAFALTEGSEQRAPMGQAVIGGVITSSLLTLVVVPVIVLYLDDFQRWMRRILGRTEPPKQPPASESTTTKGAA